MSVSMGLVDPGLLSFSTVRALIVSINTTYYMIDDIFLTEWNASIIGPQGVSAID